MRREKDQPINLAAIREAMEDRSEQRLHSCEPTPERRVIIEMIHDHLGRMNTDVLLALLPVFGRHSAEKPLTVPDPPDHLSA